MKKMMTTAVVLIWVMLASCSALGVEQQPLPETASPSETPGGVPTQVVDFSTATIPPSETMTATALPENPTATSTLVPPEKPTATPYPLGPQIGSPVSLENFAHPDLGCQWLGIAGQVFNMDGAPLLDLVVEAGGSIAGQEITELAVTGSSASYGPGSYEIELWDAPFASNGTVWVQVLNLDGVPLSDRVFLRTSDRCEENLILLNFVKSDTLPDEWIFIPLVNR